MKISKNNVATIHYTLKDDNGNVLDSSSGTDPLSYIHGQGQIIPGLENALENKSQGEKFTITISPENGYGERNEQMVQVVPKTEFQDASKIVEGMQFQVDTDDGPIVLTVIEVRNDEIVLDGNHPLAGVTLHFDIEVCDIREATEEELQHGHIHSQQCH